MPMFYETHPDLMRREARQVGNKAVVTLLYKSYNMQEGDLIQFDYFGNVRRERIVKIRPHSINRSYIIHTENYALDTDLNDVFAIKVDMYNWNDFIRGEMFAAGVWSANEAAYSMLKPDFAPSGLCPDEVG